ncbi:hypothetical protein LTH96_11830 [Nesterenkonia sp. LB17]|uniref:hypothetical protein n=1 Tax=unclassified Nesterenkonia TaxID=2629769 RepID=UPI001F4CC91E|nr:MULTISPECIES: hypothetical protein [unclassified Nesterenkonia]MCH8566404.1 hypothetical protein [Nesterenkonia sp. LB17]MCH8572132.1 hypothetical protein [Nesterenkonia sp. AY15]
MAPPTSGQSHEVESDFTDPFSTEPFGAADSVPGRGAGAAAQNPSAAEEETPGRTQKTEGSAPSVPLTAHEQWILSQRPPHWG